MRYTELPCREHVEQATIKMLKGRILETAGSKLR